MAHANDVHGAVFERGSAVMLARIVNAEGDVIATPDVASVSYTIRRINTNATALEEAVTGHDGASLTPTSVLFDTLQTSPVWTVDDTGYNFRHEVDTRQNEAFPNAGDMYQVRYELLPVSGQKVIFRFLLRAI